MIQELAVLALRLSLGAGFLSAVASRLGGWGSKSSGWDGFVEYASQVNSFLPDSWHPPMAFASTCFELLFGVSLIAGYQLTRTAYGAAALSLIFAISMGISFGIKEPLDYSVFAFCSGAWLLGSQKKDRWSIDHKLKR